MDNVSKACWIMGYNRQRFYKIRRNYQTYGAEGLFDCKNEAANPGKRRAMSRTRPESSSTAKFVTVFGQLEVQSGMSRFSSPLTKSALDEFGLV